MKKPQIFNNLVKNRGTKALAVYATLLLVMQPYALAMDQIVNKYPSGSTVAAQDIGNAHPLEVGSVFNFNNAKAPSVICLKPAEPGYPQAGCTDNLSLSEVDESNCDPESTVFPFGAGADGWEGASVLPSINVNMKFLYDATNEAINVNLTRKNQTGTFEYTKKFFYECGTPGMSDFKIRYRMLSVTGMNATAGSTNFKVDLIKPLGGIVNLVASTNVLPADTSYLWKPGPTSTDTFTIPTTNWNESGVYTIKISGQLRTGSSGQPNITLQFDDVTLNKTSLWTDYRHDVEYFVKAAPYSQLGGAGGGYVLEIKAAKKNGAADDANVLVYNGASWTNKGSISQAYDDTLPQNNLQVLSIPLSDAEYNNGLVRVRYVDATQTGDLTPGGVYIDYQRVKVDQGICVQEVRAIEADCGKCHNYNGDVTKPWPAQGMHNKHAQTESVSDCAWCHPDVTAGGTVFPSDHMNGVQAGRAIEIAGTKIFRTGGANPQGAVGSWDPATGQCTLSDCHNGLLTPSWTATYGATNGELNGTTVIARNCSRCHNTGVNNSAPAAADVNNLNIAAAWPDTLAHREHDNAFNMDENSCQANGSCHPDNRVQHTPVKDADGVSTLMSPKYQSPSGSGVKYIKTETALPGDGDGRCYNATCHGGQETPKWNAAVGSLDPTQPNSAYCKACHKGEKATTWTPGATLPDISAKQYNSPISGLHQGSPPTSGKSHVSEYGCAVCHTTNPALHFKDGTGTTNLDTWQMDPVTPSDLVGTMGYSAVGRGTPPSYSDGAAPTCATPFPGPGGLTCHAESDTTSAIGKLAGTNTSWERDWSWDAYSSNAADRCKVCHGVYGSFKTLRPAHTSSKLAGNHSDSGLDCATTCHAQTDNETIITTNIYNHGVSLSADAKTIDVNMNVGFTQSTAMETALTTAGTYAQQYVMQTGTTSTVGCTGCHVSTGSFAMQESGWKLRNQLTGPAVTCDNDAAGCHGDSASNRYWPNTAGTDDGATTADRIGAHELHMAWLANKVYSQDIAALLADAATDTKQRALCQYCHTIADVDHLSATVADVFRTAPKLIQTGVAETGTLGTFNTTPNTCSNVDCHAQYGTVAAGSEAVTTPDWYITPTHTFATTTMNCAACHNNPSSDTTGKHTVHAGTSFGVNMTCASCHNATTLPVWGNPGTPPSPNHLNGTFALASTLTPAPAYTGTYRTSFGSCGTNYCHRSDASANTAPALTATWGTAQAGSCNFCHLEATLISNKHSQHLASNSLPGTAVNECYVCHNSTATSGGLASGANHINGADDLNFNTTFANYEANTAARAAGTGATTTCSNTKCHNGVTTPTWNGTVSCGSCHNTSGTGPLPSATSVAGEHAKHANNDATYTDCAACHPNAASYIATGNGGHADHQNLTVNVTVGSAGYTDTTEGGVNYQAGDASHTDDGSCAFTGGCHGNGANVGWAIASTLTNGCFACHGGGLSATETGTTKPVENDTIPNPVNNTQYTTQGHGQAGAFPGSGVTGPGYVYTQASPNGCFKCHDEASQHSPAASATNPYRLYAAYITNTNGACLQIGCHDSPTIASHTKTVVGGTATWINGYDYKCVDCHDPHGDANYYMVRSHISAPTTTGDVSFGSNNYGTPVDTPIVAASAITFTSLAGGATANSYGVSGVTNGICEVCHVDTTEVSYYRRDNAETNTHKDGVPNQNCTTSCHKHDTGFKPSGCNGCHGGANATWTNKNMWPDLVAGSYPKRLGKHEVHINRLMSKLGYSAATITDDQQKQLCTYCHGALATIGATGHDTDNAPVTIADVTGILRIWNASADATGTTAAFSNDANATCSGIDCHNNQASGATFNWRTGTASTCAMCHTTGGTNSATTAHPSSGIHDAARITGRLHDNSFTYGTGGASTADCTTCHTTTPTTTNGHMNGTNDYSIGATDAADPKVFLAAPVGFTDAAVPTCAPTQANGCHIEQWNAVTDHTWTRLWHENAGDNTGAECKGCHGTFTQAWRTGTTPNHAADFDTNNGAEVRLNHDHGAGSETEYNQCISCHVYNDALYGALGWNPTAVNKHGNGTVEMITSMGYAPASNTCATNCHDATGGNHAMTPDSGWSVANLAGPAMTCAGCHGTITTHTDADGAGTNFPSAGGSFCLDCHTDHGAANRTGTNGANNIYIKTTYGAGTPVPTMNQQYSSATHNGWIQLGGTATGNATYTNNPTAATEAEMCWGCHEKVAVSEWGANQKAKTGNLTYDYGDLYTTISTIPGTKTSNWTTGFWRSGKGRSSQTGTNPYWYKRGSIQSTHSVNFDSGTVALTTSGNSLGFGRKENKDAVANIRCAYCHDVHGTHNGVNGDTSGGAGTADSPYLRGTWKGNPYAEDGAPVLGMGNWSPTTYYGAAPRVSASVNNTGITAVSRAGGWWIDQNSNNPNSTTNVHATSGLCAQCHGPTNKTGTWATVDLGTLDWATSGMEASNWVSGYNGHASSVLNGPGRGATASAESYARNIFTRTNRGTSRIVTGATLKFATDIGLASEPASENGYSYRSSRSDGYDWVPKITADEAYTSFAWGTARLTGGTRASIWATGSQALTFSTATVEPWATTNAQANYHTFTCSKCHNPHASRLPKLMISNCLDTNHNTWEDNTTFIGTAPTGIWANTRHSQFAAAQNCHRLDARATLTSGQTVNLGRGWNRVTPWLEFTSPNSTRTTTTPDVPVQ